MRLLISRLADARLFALFHRCVGEHGGFLVKWPLSLVFSIVALSLLSAYAFLLETGISPWATSAFCPCRCLAPAVETNSMHAAIDSMPFLPVLDYVVLSQLVLRASRRAQF